MVSNKTTRLRRRQNSLRQNFKNIKFEISSPRNSPIPQFKSDDDLNKIQRIHRMIFNWLNGLPVKEIRTFDAENFTTGRGRTGSQSSNNQLSVVTGTIPTEPAGPDNTPTGLPTSPNSPESVSNIPNNAATTTTAPSTTTTAPSQRQTVAPKRSIFVNSALPSTHCNSDGNPMQQFVDNSIRTTKYSIITFIPLNLFSQFRRIANFYFLVMIILQIIPALSQINAAISALPLFFVVSITAVKDAIEDHRRYRSDKEYNNRKSRTFIGFDNQNGRIPTNKTRIIQFVARPFKWIHQRTVGKKQLLVQTCQNTSLASLGTNFASLWKSVCWRDVCVGDVIYLKENDPVPADVILLGTSNEDCICYVETKDLDGESSLKIKRTPFSQVEGDLFANLLHNLHNFVYRVDCEGPTSNLFNFSGNLYMKQNDLDSSITDEAIINDETTFGFPLDIDNLLLRGSCVRNTHYAVGIVVYTGRESRIMQNSGGNKFKRSNIEHQLNPMIILNLCLLFMLCLTVAIIRTTITGSPENTQSPYSFSTYSSKYGQKNSCLSGLIAFFSGVLALQALVPISLYITVEFVRTVQAWFIYNDIDLYNEELDKRCLPKAWNLSDDLGQIEYIFSDKTGTLTRNIMKLRQLSINGTVYGKYELSPTSPSTTPNHELHQAELQREEEVMVAQMNELFESAYSTNSRSLVDSQLFVDVAEDDEHSNTIVTFFQVLTLCHTAVSKIQETNDDDEFLPSIEYHSQSPDEIALLETCKDLGFVFVKKERNIIRLSILGEDLEYTVLNVIEFSSSRKRMSILVQDKHGRILLLCKGADSVIYERLVEQENELSIATLENLQNFAEKGLRTLCIAYKELSEFEYASWAEQFVEAQSALENRVEKIEEVAELIERDLILLGATAVEDELQENVPEAIETLEKAGIKLWVLTGDKVETAINIGFSCNLLNRNMNLIVVRGSTFESISGQLEGIVKDLWYECITMEEESVEPTFALVIDGTSLKHALSDERNRKLFVCISGFCKSVICCRVSPLQKAKVVELIKHYKNATTLAIGDGANDVSMIKTANVGVGLFGREGMQASMASDYAITEFRHLVKLLLVHGRWSYWRTALTVLTSLFRNLIFAMIIFFFQFYCLFSASSAYDFVFGLLYNLLFVVLPSVAIGIFEADLTAKYCVKVPQLYQMGIKKSVFNIRKYLLFMFQGVYITLVCYFFTLVIFSRPGANGYFGHTLDLFQFGSMLVVEIVFIAVIFTGMHISNWNIWVQIAVWGNLVIFIVFFIIYSFLATTFMYGQFLEVFGTPLFYFTFALIIPFSLGPTFLYKYFQNEFFPRDIDIVQDIQNTKRNEAALFQSCLQPPHYQISIEPIVEEIMVTSPEIQATVPDTLINLLEKPE